MFLLHVHNIFKNIFHHTIIIIDFAVTSMYYGTLNQ